MIRCHRNPPLRHAEYAGIQRSDDSHTSRVSSDTTRPRRSTGRVTRRWRKARLAGSSTVSGMKPNVSMNRSAIRRRNNVSLCLQVLPYYRLRQVQCAGRRNGVHRFSHPIAYVEFGPPPPRRMGTVCSSGAEGVASRHPKGCRGRTDSFGHWDFVLRLLHDGVNCLDRGCASPTRILIYTHADLATGDPNVWRRVVHLSSDRLFPGVVANERNTFRGWSWKTGWWCCMRSDHEHDNRRRHVSSPLAIWES